MQTILYLKIYVKLVTTNDAVSNTQLSLYYNHKIQKYIQNIVERICSNMLYFQINNNIIRKPTILYSYYWLPYRRTSRAYACDPSIMCVPFRGHQQPNKPGTIDGAQPFISTPLLNHRHYRHTKWVHPFPLNYKNTPYTLERVINSNMHNKHGNMHTHLKIKKTHSMLSVARLAPTSIAQTTIMLSIKSLLHAP